MDCVRVVQFCLCVIDGYMGLYEYVCISVWIRVYVVNVMSSKAHCLSVVTTSRSSVFSLCFVCLRLLTSMHTRMPSIHTLRESGHHRRAHAVYSRRGLEEKSIQ